MTIIITIWHVIRITSVIDFINIMMIIRINMMTIMIIKIIVLITSEGRLGPRVSPPPRPATLT